MSGVSQEDERKRTCRWRIVKD